MLERNQEDVILTVRDYQTAMAEEQCLCKEHSMSMSAMRSRLERVEKDITRFKAQLPSLWAMDDSRTERCEAYSRREGKKTLQTLLAESVSKNLVFFASYLGNIIQEWASGEACE